MPARLLVWFSGLLDPLSQSINFPLYFARHTITSIKNFHLPQHDLHVGNFLLDIFQDLHTLCSKPLFYLQSPEFKQGLD